jgi:hypothetical protein
MIALSPVWWSWQKTTCSWSAGPGRPFSLWGIANTLVTVATLSSRPGSSLNRDRNQAYCLRGPAGRVPEDGRRVAGRPDAPRTGW